MGQSGDAPGFTIESPPNLGVFCQMAGQHFDCDIAMKFRVVGEVDLSGVASSEPADNFVLRQARVRREHTQRWESRT
jgi:hypothetical protein